MEVILIEPVDGLGERGATVRVADGYARNYLLPRKLAITAAGNVANMYRSLARHAEQREARERQASEQIAAAMAGVKLTITEHANEEGALFGSVGAAHIADELGKLGHPVEKRMVRLDEPIKQVGSFEVPVRLKGNVTVTVPVEVVAG